MCVDTSVKAALAQTSTSKDQFILPVDKTKGPIKIDGIPTQEEWAHVKETSFVQVTGTEIEILRGTLKVQYDKETVYFSAQSSDSKLQYGDTFTISFRTNVTDDSKRGLMDYLVTCFLTPDLRLYLDYGENIGESKPPHFDEVEAAYNFNKTISWEVSVPTKMLSSGLKTDPTQVESFAQIFDDIHGRNIRLVWPPNNPFSKRSGLLIFSTPIPDFNLLPLTATSALALAGTNLILRKNPKRKKEGG